MGRTKRQMHVTRVFMATQVNKNAVRAFFRKESGYGHGAAAVGYSPTQAHVEQMLRLRERARRARGMDTLMGLPDWYVALRSREIAQGAQDPMTNFKRVPEVAQ